MRNVRKEGRVAPQGATFQESIEFTDSENNPVDLTGHNVRLVVYPLNGVGVIGTYEATVGVGTADITVTDEVTAAWPVGKSGYRVEHESPNGVINWWYYGSLTVFSGRDV